MQYAPESLDLIQLWATPVAAQTTVFINEIHHDNTGVDTGEMAPSMTAVTPLATTLVARVTRAAAVVFQDHQLPASPGARRRR